MKTTIHAKHGHRSVLTRLTALTLAFLFAFTTLVTPVFAQEAPPTETPIPPINDTPSQTPVQHPSEPLNENKPTTDSKPEDSEADKTKDPTTPAPTSLLSGDPEPEKTGKVVEKKVHINESNGALVYEYPLTVPPGRNDLHPDLKLAYDSQNSEEGSIFGYGWSVNIPYIERINRKGSEKLYTENYFNSSLTGELLLISGSDWGSKVDNGEFLKYSLSSNVWTVKDKRGTVYKFGTNAAERQDNPSDSTKIYKWMLQEVRDTNDNYIKYEYYKDGGQIYPSKIKYTGNNVTDGIFEVEFLRQSRTDAIKSHKTAFSVTTSFRINEIQTKVSASWVRKYVLAYVAGDNGARSMLDTITESGRDDAGNTTSLPAINFDYQTTTAGWDTNTTTYTLPTYVGLFQSVLDVNGDSLVDIIESYKENGGSDIKNTYLNNGNNTWSVNTGLQPPILFREYAVRGGAYGNVWDNGVRLADINGDQWPDIIKGFDGASSYTAYLNSGTGWTLNTGWAPTIGFDHNNSISAYGTISTDLNGDTLPDIIQKGQGNNDEQLNTGTAFATATTNWSPPSSGLTHPNNQVVDVNGDGLPDVLDSFYTNNGFTYNANAYLNLGNDNWSASEASFVTPTPFVNGASNIDMGVRFMDVNGDGLSDMVIDPINQTGGARHTHLNTGTGWAAATSWNMPSGVDLLDGEAHPTDLNEDGLLDFLYSATCQQGICETAYINKTTKVPDLLSKVTYTTGGSTEITYQKSAKYRDGSSNLLNPNLPVNLNTVKTIVHKDGLSGIDHTINYSYEGGRYYYSDAFDRKLAGFHKVIMTDAADNVTKTYFHQGNTTDSSSGEYSDHASKIGKPYRVEVLDGSGNIHHKTINKWDRHDLGNGRSFVKLVQKIEMAYDGDSDHKDKAETYTYDNTYGNITQRVELGEVTGADAGTYTDTGSDKFTTDITYAENSTAYIVGLPKQETTINQSSVKVKESKFYYDVQVLGTVTDGNLTKEERWKTGTSYIDIEKTYNTTYGLVTQEKDPRDKTTTYSYDTHNLYPATVTNALSQATSYTYDYSSGKVKTTTDPNTRVFETVYDGLDRVKEEKQPDIATPGTLVTKTTYTYTDNVNPTSVKKSDTSDGLANYDTYTYFDGLGRMLQTRKEAEDSNTFSTKDFIYNNRGLLNKESLPYFSTGTTRTTATSTANLLITYSYDPMDRVTTTVNAVGTTTNAYDDWKMTITDAKSEVKHLHKDAYDNLILVEEVVTTGGPYQTYYEYNYLGNLTKITDAEGNVRNFTYDGLGRRLTAQDLHASADTSFGSWTYTYDDSGNMTSRTDAKSQTIDNTYDDINRVLTENYTGATGTEQTYTYDSPCPEGVGRLCSAVATGVSTHSFEYNALGNVKKETKNIDSTNYITEYTYDRLGNTLTIKNPDNSEIKYTYNTAGLLETIQRKESGESFTDVVVDFDYSPTEEISYQEYSNGAKTTNTYDADKLYRLANKLTLLPDTGVQGEGGGILSMLQSMSSDSTSSSFTGDPLNSNITEQNDPLVGQTFFLNYDKSAKPTTVTREQKRFYDQAAKNQKPGTYTPGTYPAPDSGGGVSMLSGAAPRYSQNMNTEGLWITESITYNHGFENSFNDWNFFTTLSATQTVDCTVAYSGSCSMKVVSSTTGNNWDTIAWQVLRIDPATNYKLKFKAKASAAATVVASVNQNHSPYNDYGLGKTITVPTTWKEYTYTFTSTAGSVDEDSRVYFGLGASGTTVWIDDVELIPDALNKVKNPSFESANANWAFWADTGGGASATNSNNCSSSTDGDCSNFTDVTTAGSNWQIQLNHNTSVNSADTYVVKFNAKASAQRDAKILLSQDHSPWTELTPQVNFTIHPGWNTYIVELTPSSTDSNARLQYFLGQYTPDVYIDNVRMWKKQNTKVTDTTPEFSEIFDDPDTADTATKYQIQVIAKGGSFASPLWDSGQVTISPAVNEGSRTVDASYVGTALNLDGKKYYWRVKLWDNTPTEGPWTNGRDYFIMSGRRAQDISYTYDAVGNITKIVDASDTNAGKTVDYTYDDLHRLTGATYTNLATGQQTFSESYSYSAIGNISSKTGVGNYTYAGNTGTSKANPHAVTSTSDGSISYTYDDNGNLLTVTGGLSNTWSYDNKLTQAVLNSTTTTYGYDTNGQRVKYNNGSTTTVYPTKNYNVTGSDKVKHIFTPDGVMIATINGSGASATIALDHTDHLTGANVVSNTNGQIQELADYYPFGTVRLNESINLYKEQRKFAGHEFDNETGLSYMNARYYNGKTGRFASQDPAFLWIGDQRFKEKYGRELTIHLTNPQNLNAYSYANNNPLVYIDKTGELPVLIIAWAVLEVGLTLYDGYSTYRTVKDTNTSNTEKSASVGLFFFGLIAPGGGYGQIDNAFRAIKNFDNFKFARNSLDNSKNVIKVQGKISTGDKIDGVGVSRHAAEQAADRGISRNQIQQALNKGGQYYDTKNDSFVWVINDRFSRYSVVTTKDMQTLKTVQDFVPNLKADNGQRFIKIVK